MLIKNNSTNEIWTVVNHADNNYLIENENHEFKTITQGIIERMFTVIEDDSENVEIEEDDDLLELLNDIKNNTEEHTTEPVVTTNLPKPMFSLIPQYGLEEVANVFTYGYQKYGAFNYDKHTIMEYIDKTHRHINSYLKGDSIDESGFHNLAHAASNLLMALDLYKTNLSPDNRNKSYNLK